MQPPTPDSPGPSRERSATVDRTNRVNRLDRLAALEVLRVNQRGVVRREQLRALGWTRHHIDHETTYGRWHQAAPEVIAMQNAALTYEQQLWLGVLHAGPGSALSHGTTLKINGLRRWEPDVIDVLSKKSHTLERLEGFFFHETRREYDAWVHPVRTPPQLCIEQACLLAAERKRSVRVGIGLVAACVQQRLTASDRLYEVSLTISKLRHGRQIRLALLDIAGGAQSFAEIDLGRLCREFGLQAPTRQVFRYDSRGRRRYLDCVWELDDGTKIVLEIDGSFHLESENWWKDMVRERGVVIDFGRVLRCSTFEIRNQPGGIMRDLRAIGVPYQR